MPCLKPCAEYGCPALVPSGRCEKHKVAPVAPHRKAGKLFYKSRPWRAVRAAYLAAHPLCEDCGVVMANEVHHIEKRIEGGDMSHDNLMALCKPCHSIRTNRGE